ncbi:16S rRNA (cytosine(1402)-N(4))-methyltransferase RsmH, partial [Patescibacteria group bacterium]|nr:16S rRNA (cytosine(1402)-N(4))-methyltransferase RsmH [Patescibacteria group bacterium]
RGFSFSKEGPLDMRFDQRSKLTAADVLNSYSEEDLTKIFFEYGEEKMARKAAKCIVEDRAKEKFVSTKQLGEMLERVLRKKRSSKASKAHPATKIFQALRIEVNDEIEALKEALQGAIEILNVGGRIAIISYHSLEDRIVKQFFKDLLKPRETDPEKSIYQNYAAPYFESLSRKPIIPSEKELEENPRSRSAKLRIYKKLREIS